MVETGDMGFDFDKMFHDINSNSALNNALQKNTAPGNVTDLEEGRAPWQDEIEGRDTTVMGKILKDQGTKFIGGFGGGSDDGGAGSGSDDDGGSSSYPESMNAVLAMSGSTSLAGANNFGSNDEDDGDSDEDPYEGMPNLEMDEEDQHKAKEEEGEQWDKYFSNPEEYEDDHFDD
jgi:hypothetical protein